MMTGSTVLYFVNINVREIPLADLCNRTRHPMTNHEPTTKAAGTYVYNRVDVLTSRRGPQGSHRIASLKNGNPTLGTARLHAVLLSENPSWAVSENRLRRILKNSNPDGPLAQHEAPSESRASTFFQILRLQYWVQDGARLPIVHARRRS